MYKAQLILVGIHRPMNRLSEWLRFMFGLRSFLVWMMVLICCGLGGCNNSECQRTWSSAVTPSSDGKWFAEIHQYVCDAGLGSFEEEDVELRLADKPQSRRTVLSPTGQWQEPSEVTLRWLNANTLEVTVPNRTRFGTQVPRYDGVEIQVRYKNDDPVDRANWLATVKKNIDWTRESSGKP